MHIFHLNKMKKHLKYNFDSNLWDCVYKNKKWFDKNIKLNF